MGKILRDGKSNSKIRKNPFRTWNVALAHANTSGYEVCPYRSEGCTEACNSMAGRGHMPSVQQARIRLTRRFFEDRVGFLAQLQSELDNANRLMVRTNDTGLVRLNTSSDIAWERMIRIDHSNLRYYDYTKSLDRAMMSLNGHKLYNSYRLCYSWNENSNEADVESYLDAGGTVAVVVDVPYNPQSGVVGSLPTVWKGRPMIDGDETDDRYHDPKGVWIGLRLKGMNNAKDAARASKFANLTINGQ
jgi:hypothetical protein